VFTACLKCDSTPRIDRNARRKNSAQNAAEKNARTNRNMKAWPLPRLGKALEWFESVIRSALKYGATDYSLALEAI